MASNPTAVRLNNNVQRMNTYPFNVGAHYYANSSAGTTMYSCDHPGDQSATQYARFQQTISGNKAFVLPATVNAPQNTTGGALSDANQLRVIALVNDVAPTAPRARGDQAAPSNGFIVAAGGGTAAGDATLSIKGTTASALLVGSTQISVASSGVDTNTILVGDKLNIAGDSTDYYATATTATLNGTTEVLVSVTPPLQKAAVAATAVTVTAAGGRTILFNVAPPVGGAGGVGGKVEILVMNASDISTVTGGAMTAARPYDLTGQQFYFTSGIVDFTRALL